MKRIKLIALSCLTLAALNTAHATMPLPMGWYVEGNIGLPEVNNIDYASNASNSMSGLAWSVNAGYKFMPFFALEGGYINYATTNIENNDTKVGKATSQTFDLVGKVMLPIQNSGFEFMAKLGVGRTKTHVTASDPTYAAANGVTVNAGTDNATALIYGLGGEYAFYPEMLVNAQWTRSDGGSTTGNLDLYSIGIAYLFG
jgi:hypothetical protein